jgi:glycosyltransferase involved in cell wall biosynthesis
VVRDDGSIEDTLAVAQGYAVKDSRVEVYHQENQGVAATRNNLLEKVRGDWVLFVDADDWIELDMVETLLALAVENNAEIAECKNVINDTTCDKDNPTITLWNQEEAVFQFLRHKIFSGSLWNKLIKASLLKNERFPDNVSYGEDALFCWHILQKVNTIVRTSAQYYHYKMNDTSISHQKYDIKHMSGHIVWKQISEETETLWPQYKEIADATYAISDMWQLYNAAKSKYPQDLHIKEYQSHVRKSLYIIYNSHLINTKKMLFAIAVSISYRWGGFVVN